MTTATSQSDSAATSLDTLAAQIRIAHSECERSFKTGLEHVCHAGELLIEAKSRVPYGNWLTWLADNCELSERSAQTYMRVSRACRLDPQRAADLSLRDGLKLLAQKGGDNSRSSQPTRNRQANHQQSKSEFAESPFDTAAEAARCRTAIDETIARCPEPERDQFLEDLWSEFEPLWQPQRVGLDHTTSNTAEESAG